MHITKVFIFLVFAKAKLKEWQTALSSYVINCERVELKYDIIDKLGRGSFGYVLLAQEKKDPSEDDHSQGKDPIEAKEESGKKNLKIALKVLEKQKILSVP